MAPEHRLDLLSPAGVKQAEIGDFLSFAGSTGVNVPGRYDFTLSGEHPSLPYWTDKSQVELWRRDVDQGIPWYVEFRGLYRVEDASGVDPGVFVAGCPGQLSMLGWRHVAYYERTANRSRFVSSKGETIMKTLVSYNAGPQATTANGRIRTPASLGITVEADGARGNTIAEWNSEWKNLLGELQALAAVAGGDFDLVKTGPQTWDFRFFPGSRGTDRRATVLFSPDRGNMAEPQYNLNRSEEKTVALVAGQGELSERNVIARTSTTYSAANDIETFITATQHTTTAALQAYGDAQLEELRAKGEFTFRPLQTPSTQYGKHYFIGDLVRARYRGVTQDIQITGARISSDGGVQIEMRVL